MKLSEFIQSEVFSPRLAKAEVLVVYDTENLYREICLAMESDDCKVIDATDSSIESREGALKLLSVMGDASGTVNNMLVYIPAKAPITDEDCQRDPFAIHTAIGEVFPDGDRDEFQSICMTAKPDHTTQIRQIFRDNPTPGFEVIDAIGGGSGWPQLQAALSAESARDLLFSLLVPTDSQKEKLKENDAWVLEAKELLERAIGLKLITRGKTWNTIGDELWRYTLYSEFVFDLPTGLPDALADVPRADVDARPVIEELCERLRSDQRQQSNYIDRALEIEKELNLPDACKSIKNLGVRDTFAFEERSFFAQAVEALKGGLLDQVREILGRHSDSVWLGRGESQAQWQLLRSALSLIECCEDADEQLPEHARSQQSLIDFYVATLREVDRLQREFEQAAPDWLLSDSSMQEIVDTARAVYQKQIERIQSYFVRHLISDGWPATGMQSNADTFDKMVAPKLKTSGNRVAYILVDALRYELGVALEQQLRDDGQVEIIAACALLPSVTPVGMAGLLPGAGDQLLLDDQNGDCVSLLGEQKLKTVANRMAVFKTLYGARFSEVKLDALIKPRFKTDAAIDLLVVRTNDIDERFETSVESGLSDVATQLKRLRVAVHKLRDLEFDEVVIATDHGFFINLHAGDGDVGTKPLGKWKPIHGRSLLGDGTEDAQNYVVQADHLGIRGSYSQYAGPKGLVAYSKGVGYFHGGASLQECIVPVITVRLKDQAEQEVVQEHAVELSYKSNKIRTLLPVLDVAIKQSDFIAAEVEVLLEAQDKDGNVIGEAKPGGAISASTGTIHLLTGNSARVTLRMDEDYEGKVIVKAMDPVTLRVYGKLNLQTDYMN